MMQHDFSSGTANSASVGNTNTAIVAAKPARKYLCIVNDGSVAVYLNLGGTAVANKGIRLNANGGALEISGDHPFRGAVNGITASGTAVVTYFEA